MISVIIIAAILMIGAFIGLTTTGKSFIKGEDVELGRKFLVFRWLVCGGESMAMLVNPGIGSGGD